MGKEGKPKVLFCTDGVFPHAVGGMQRHSRLLVEALAATGEVELTVLHPHGGQRIFAGLPGVEEVALPAPPGKRHYFLELQDYARHVLAECLRRPDHIVYAQGLSVWAGAERLRGRLIVNPHGLEPFQALGWKDWLKTWPYRRAFRRIFAQATRVVSLGGRLTDILRRNGGGDRVVVLPNATNLPPVPADALVKDKGAPMRFLFVGRFAGNKGIDVLLAAAERLNAAGLQDRYTLDLGGKGPLFEQMQARYPLPNVRFLGFVGDAELERLYRGSHVFLFPTLFEGMPTVVLEAMSWGLPVIVTDTGATLELVDEDNGTIIGKGDVAAVEQAVLQWLDLPADTYRARSEASLRKVAARFTWPAVAEAHLALFRDLWYSS